MRTSECTKCNQSPASGDSATTYDGVILWHWHYEYYGAVFDADLVYYAPHRFCIEGKLTYQGIIKVAEGEVCGELTENGSLRLWGDAEIKIVGEKVATASASVSFHVDYQAGYAYLDQYSLEVCGTNTFELKCKKWEWTSGRDAAPEGAQSFLPFKGALSDQAFTLRLFRHFPRKIGPLFQQSME